MSYQPLEDLLPRSNWSIYRLVRLASKRALEISETGGRLVNLPSETKLATVALEEIRAGKVVDKLVHDAQEKENKAKKSK